MTMVRVARVDACVKRVCGFDRTTGWSRIDPDGRRKPWREVHCALGVGEAL